MLRLSLQPNFIAAAKAEGELTTIALPHDWCGYGDIIKSFKDKYGIKVNELNPDAGSGDEVEAIKANKNNKGPQAPDVIDVGFAFGTSVKKDGLTQAYKVSTWDEIPDSAKDPEGHWYGDYYGVLAFEVNKDIVRTRHRIGKTFSRAIMPMPSRSQAIRAFRRRLFSVFMPPASHAARSRAKRLARRASNSTRN